MIESAKGKKRRRVTVVVAGGAGFIGSHLCEILLAQSDRVICIDNFLTSSRKGIGALESQKNFRLIDQDICQPFDIDEPADQVYNLACAASPMRYQADPVHTLMTSVVGTHNLLKLAERSGARFLQASTSEVYGDPEEHPQREDYPGKVSCTGPRACYDEGKRAAEALCFDYLRAGRADVRVARIFNTYGPRMQPDDGRIVSNLIVQAIGGKNLTIYGSGKQTRSFCYVSDMVRGLMALMDVEPNPEAPVNLGNPGEFTINELAAMVKEITGTASKVIYRPLPPDDPQRRRPDISRAKRLLDWQPEIGLAEGLPLTVAWFSDHLDSRQADRKGAAADDARRVRQAQGETAPVGAETLHG